MSGQYPENWWEIAQAVKNEAGWECERCHHPHDPDAGYCLTVHHLVGDKGLVERWNLAALCQRCHLHIQAKVNMFQELMDFVVISDWFVPHLAGFRKWQKERDDTGVKAELDACLPGGTS